MMSSSMIGTFIALGALAALCVAYWGIVLGALNRMTRTDAREAATKHLGGRYITQIIDRRPAAVSAVALLRIVNAVLCVGFIGMAFAGVIPQPWLWGLVSMGLACLMMLLFVLLLPGGIGYKHPINVLASCSHILWGSTRIVGLIVTRREPDDEDEREEQQEDHLAVMVERVSESAAVEDDERDVLHSLFELDSTYIREVMVPRTDIISISGQASLDKALSLFSRSGFSRVPVIGEDVDDLLGVVYLKDVIKRVHHRNDSDSVSVADVMREAMFVPETKRVDDMLHQMQATAVHIAMVVDEYGGIAGLVTIEDLLEELVGEMTDEHDKAEPEVEDLGEGRFRVPARLAIDELGDLYGLELDDDDVDSVGGLLAKAIGRVPIAGAEGELYGVCMRADRFEGRRKRLSTVIVEYIPEESDASARSGDDTDE